ncbi:MAG: hypothetical protein KAI79_20275 [Bacteroidales bacterium]|nr:hypothetical protein [Bacteroidales bacterium]
MRKLTIVTTNKHKFEEMSAVLFDFDIELKQLIKEYPEDKELEMREIALVAAKNLANELNEEVIVEDTGLYFEAYNNFPGAQPKFVYNSLGFKGIFKLLEGEDRKARFKTVIGCCKPGEEAVAFEGEMKGEISDKVFSEEKSAMPYDYIFIPDGYNRAIVDMSLEEKNSFSQRGKATRLLGEYLKNN